MPELRFDPEADMWYLALRDTAPGCVARTKVGDDYNLDYDADGTLVGVEVFGPLPIQTPGSDRTEANGAHRAQ